MSVVTVTTTTTAVVATTTLEIAAALGAIGTGMLILALIANELSTSYEGQEPIIKGRLELWIGCLNLLISSMLVIFALIVAVKVGEILGW